MFSSTVAGKFRHRAKSLPGPERNESDANITNALCDPVDHFVQCAVAASGNDFIAVIADRFARECFCSSFIFCQMKGRRLEPPELLFYSVQALDRPRLGI